jgi:hypothetical protein
LVYLNNGFFILQSCHLNNISIWTNYFIHNGKMASSTQRFFSSKCLKMYYIQHFSLCAFKGNPLKSLFTWWIWISVPELQQFTVTDVINSYLAERNILFCTKTTTTKTKNNKYLTLKMFTFYLFIKTVKNNCCINTSMECQ